MKKFKFSLESVLTYKLQVLDAIQGEYAECQARVREQEALLERLWADYRAYNEEFRQRKENGMTIRDAMVYESGLRVLERDIQRETERLEELRRQAEKKRLEMVEAKKETSSLEKLKEKKLGLYERAVQKSEEQFVEEFVNSAMSRTDGASA